jgi:PAS domain-containing protein
MDMHATQAYESPLLATYPHTAISGLQPTPPPPLVLPSSRRNSQASPETHKGTGQEYYGLYSNSGFDMLTALAKVASRKNPVINIGPVDLSSAFAVADALAYDFPIIYVSPSFETLTGYAGKEVMGKNCRFLQSPNGVMEKGQARPFSDEEVAYKMKKSIEEAQECQYMNINYKKGGEVS